jgi:hypothetical protein
MKKILIMLLTMSFISSNDNFTKSTMSILELQSSKVLTNFQGKELDQSNSLMHAQSNSLIQSNLIYSIGRSIQIRQIDENTFEVISISQSDNRQSNRGISNRGLSK